MLAIFSQLLTRTLSQKTFFILATLFTLTACSPHPGAGKWKADTENSHEIDTINIIFEGQADFYTKGKDESIRRCFWSATGKQSMSMQCVHSDNTENKVLYLFTVTEAGHAQLTSNDQLVALFTLQKPEKEASFW
ncbi:MAG: hypothetical protein GY694_07385 [Gammaproteobacteria bacterium]|nr:hypothetical protein [Gammaproteobacteria bacterium]